VRGPLLDAAAFLPPSWSLRGERGGKGEGRTPGGGEGEKGEESRRRKRGGEMMPTLFPTNSFIFIFRGFKIGGGGGGGGKKRRGDLSHNTHLLIINIIYLKGEEKGNKELKEKERGGGGKHFDATLHHYSSPTR